MEEKAFVVIDACERMIEDLRLQLWEAEAEARFKGELGRAIDEKRNGTLKLEDRYHLALVAEAFTEQTALAERQALALRHNLEFYRARLELALEGGQ